MAYNLFLDDIRTPEMVSLYFRPVELREVFRTKEWKIARNYDEFVSLILSEGIPSLVSFDHDLAPEHYVSPDKWDAYDYDDYYKETEEKTGLDCAKFLVRTCIDFNVDWFPNYLIHSQNPVGSENIQSYLKSYEKSKSK